MSKHNYRANRSTSELGVREGYLTSKSIGEKSKMNASCQKFPSSSKAAAQTVAEPSIIGGERKVQIIAFNPGLAPIELNANKSRSFSESSSMCCNHQTIKVRNISM